MKLHDALRGRRSIRRYRDQRVPDELLRELLDLARHAPSSMNAQPWQFVVVREAAAKQRFAEIKNRFCPVEKSEFSADFLRSAPVIVVICVERARAFERGVENAVLAASNLMLAAHGFGLGSVYMSAHRPGQPALAQAIRDLLGIPAQVDPICLIPLGYPDETVPAKELRALETLIHDERY